MVLPGQQCYDSNSCPWGYECRNGLCNRREYVDSIGACFEDNTCPAGYQCLLKDVDGGHSTGGHNCFLNNWDLVGKCMPDGRCVGGYVCNHSNNYCYCV